MFPLSVYREGEWILACARMTFLPISSTVVIPVKTGIQRGGEKAGKYYFKIPLRPSFGRLRTGSFSKGERSH